MNVKNANDQMLETIGKIDKKLEKVIIFSKMLDLYSLFFSLILLNYWEFSL